MMKARRILVATAAGLAAAAVGVVPASAATINVTELPDKVDITTADSIDVTDSTTRLCGEGSLRVYVPGRQDAVNVLSHSCDGNVFHALVAPADSKKKNAVVKFRLTKPNGSTVMYTLVVHVAR